MQKNIIPQRKKSIGSRVIDGRAYLVSLDDGPRSGETFYSLNSTGTRIWNLINGRNNIGDIAARISAESGLGRPAAQKQVSQFIKSLYVKGLTAIKAASPK